MRIAIEYGDRPWVYVDLGARLTAAEAARVLALDGADWALARCDPSGRPGPAFSADRTLKDLGVLNGEILRLAAIPSKSSIGSGRG